ncbi:MAG: DUF1223 domain-containing protein, partial [Rhizobiales bacterium]|nr:DUF1223 domain-containing protein [Hyphomicrobiales bacterium]
QQQRRQHGEGFGAEERPLRQRIAAADQGRREPGDEADASADRGGAQFDRICRESVAEGQRAEQRPVVDDGGESGGRPDGDVKATLWLVLYDRHVRVPVGRGENKNRTLDYYNVVRRMYPLAMWRGEPIKVDLPMGKYHQSDADGCALLLQEEGAEGRPGPIIGAARIEGAEGRW